MGYKRLCAKNPVSTLTHQSIRPFRSPCEGFFATKEACFYSKKSYKGTTFGAKPGISRKWTCMLAEVKHRKSQDIGDLTPGFMTITSIRLAHHGKDLNYNMFYVARNGAWVQILRMRWVGDG
jgi:hypothetical protein